jgi:DNA-binding XRE family transcriptional regulator
MIELRPNPVPYSESEYQCGYCLVVNTPTGTQGWQELVINLRDQDEVRAEFEERISSLSTLGDFKKRLRAKDPDFDAHYNKARRERYRELLREAKAGSLSRAYVERIHHRMSQSELAKRLNTQQPNISRMERTGHTIRVQMAKRLAAVFEIDYREFL